MGERGKKGNGNLEDGNNYLTLKTMPKSAKTWENSHLDRQTILWHVEILIHRKKNELIRGGDLYGFKKKN